MRKLNLLPTLLAAAAMAACTSHNGWKVQGTLDNAPEDALLVLEGFNGAYWYTIDSIPVTETGDFAYEAETGAPYPDVYRLSLGPKTIYFPIDSIETVTVNADAQLFDLTYILDGTPTARQMMELDQKIQGIVNAKGAKEAVRDSVLKRQINETILADSTGILAYYIINKTVEGQPLYSIDNRRDVAMMGAIANKFASLFPNDPRTKYLADRFMSVRQQAGLGPQQTLEATVTGFVDMELYNPKGNTVKLSDLVNDSGITLLSFTSYNIEPSVAYNIELNRLYQLFQGSNLGIYQVAFDDDEVAWRKAATNLPWTAVRYNPLEGNRLLRVYNVGTIPVTFIIDGNGDLVERVDDPAELEKAIKKHL